MVSTSAHAHATARPPWLLPCALRCSLCSLVVCRVVADRTRVICRKRGGGQSQPDLQYPQGDETQRALASALNTMVGNSEQLSANRQTRGPKSPCTGHQHHLPGTASAHRQRGRRRGRFALDDSISASARANAGFYALSGHAGRLRPRCGNGINVVHPGCSKPSANTPRKMIPSRRNTHSAQGRQDVMVHLRAKRCWRKWEGRTSLSGCLYRYPAKEYHHALESDSNGISSTEITEEMLFEQDIPPIPLTFSFEL